MFCTNCGHKLYDDAVFCSYCGIKLHKEENEAAVSVSAPMIKPESQVGPADNENRQVATVEALPNKAAEEGVVPVNILVQPVPDSIETKEEEKNTAKIEDNDSGQNIPYENQQYLQQEPEPVAEVKENKKKNIFAFSILSVLFAVFTIAASVFEMLDASSELSDVARLIEISITSVILIVFAFLNYRTVSVLKSIALVITMAADIIFIGYSSIEYACMVWHDVHILYYRCHKRLYGNERDKDFNFIFRICRRHGGRCKYSIQGCNRGWRNLIL